MLQVVCRSRLSESCYTLGNNTEGQIERMAVIKEQHVSKGVDCLMSADSSSISQEKIYDKNDDLAKNIELNVSKDTDVSLETSTQDKEVSNIMPMISQAPSPPSLTSPPLPPPPPPPPPPPQLPEKNSTLTLVIDVPDPKQKLKPLQWKRITKTKGNLWEEVKEMEDPVEVDYCKIEKLFFCKPTLSKTSCQRKKNLLDHQKAMSVNVFLKKFKSVDYLIEIIQTGNTDTFGLEHYEELHKMLSNKELANRLREQSLHDIDRTSHVDYFMVRLINLPDCEQWVQMVITKEKLDGFNHLPDNLEILRKSCRLLMSNESFHKFLRFVLHVGLFMNKGKVLGGAVGFEIRSLAKLAETKSTENDNFTLLDFVVGEIHKSGKSCLGFVNDLHDNLQQTKSSTMAQSLNDFEQMQLRVTDMTKLIDTLEESSLIKDKCFQFKKTAIETKEKIQMMVEETKVAVKETASYFGEESNTFCIDETLTCCRELCEKIKSIQFKEISLSRKFIRGNTLRSSLPIGRRKSAQETTTNDLIIDTRLSALLAKQRRRSESIK